MKTFSFLFLFTCFSNLKFSFSQKTNLLSHLKRTHPLEGLIEENRFACDNCTCTFTKLNSLNRHKAKNHQTSESARLAQLEIAFQDDTPVDDAAELARNVLLELKKLQDDMEPVILQTTSKECKINETTVADTVQMSTIIDHFATDVIQVIDKLNPLKECKTFDVQCIKRNDGIVYYVCDYCAKEFRKSYDLIRYKTKISLW